MPGPKTDIQVLLDHSKPLANGCILWTGNCDKDGYPKVRRRSKRFGRISLAHRLAYLLKYGTIPTGLEVDHKCKNRSCVNPDHLEAVSHAENVRRGDYHINHRNKIKTHCIRGHQLSGENLLIERYNGVTMRKCRTCRRARMRNRYALKLLKLIHGITIKEI